MLKRTDLVPLTVLGVVGVVFGLLRRDGGALALGLALTVVAVIGMATYRSTRR